MTRSANSQKTLARGRCNIEKFGTLAQLSLGACMYIVQVWQFVAPDVGSHHLQQAVQLRLPEAPAPRLQMLQLLKLDQMEERAHGRVAFWAQLEDDAADVGAGSHHEAQLFLRVEMLLLRGLWFENHDLQV